MVYVEYIYVQLKFEYKSGTIPTSRATKWKAKRKNNSNNINNTKYDNNKNFQALSTTIKTVTETKRIIKTTMIILIN